MRQIERYVTSCFPNRALVESNAPSTSTGTLDVYESLTSQKLGRGSLSHLDIRSSVHSHTPPKFPSRQPRAIECKKAKSELSTAILNTGPVSYFIMAMPYPGTPGTPFFDGRNVTDFLDRFSDLCDDYKLSNSEKMQRLPRYCDMRIGQTIETIKEWNRSWTTKWLRS